MLKTLFTYMEMVFTSYFTILTVICGIILSFVYPILLIDSEFKIEYMIGKYVGYLYIIGSIFFLIITKLFG